MGLSPTRQVLFETARARGDGGVSAHAMRGRSPVTIDTSHPYIAGTEHVGFSPTRQALFAPRTRGEGEGVALMSCEAVVVWPYAPRVPTIPGRRNVEFFHRPGKTLLAPTAKRRGVFGE